MSKKIGVAAILIAMVMLIVGFSGCIGDPDDVEWTDPTQVSFDSMEVIEANETVDVTFSLGDKNDGMTRASGDVRVEIWDSTEFKMLDKTYPVKAKDFFSFTFLGIKVSQYTLEVPFSDFEKSHDRGYDWFSNDNTLNGTIYFTWKKKTFEGPYDGWVLPNIPEGLLHPNEAPQADLVVSNPGYVWMAVVCDGSGSFDLEGGDLLYEFDWGDGDVTSAFVAEAEESHIYDIADTYTITMTVTDPEDATSTKTMDVTIEWSLAITVGDWGIVTEGTHENQTFVELVIDNLAPAETSIPEAGMDGIKLKDTDDVPTDASETNVAIPETIVEDGGVTVIVYFMPLEGYTPIAIDVWGRELVLS